MKYSLVWMPISKSTFNKNIEYLEREWSEAVIKRFLERVDKVLRIIGDDPYVYTFYKTSKSVRRCIINERIILFYRISPSKQS